MLRYANLRKQVGPFGTLGRFCQMCAKIYGERMAKLTELLCYKQRLGEGISPDLRAVNCSAWQNHSSAEWANLLAQMGHLLLTLRSGKEKGIERYKGIRVLTLNGVNVKINEY